MSELLIDGGLDETADLGVGEPDLCLGLEMRLCELYGHHGS